MQEGEENSTQHTVLHSWTASEYISRDKSFSWFLGLGAVSVALSIIVFLITRDIFAIVVIVILIVAFGMFGARPPRVLSFSLEDDGVTAGHRFFSYSMFKSFSVIEEGAIDCIWLISLKRFAPPVAMYFDPTEEEKIVQILSDYLPHEDRKRDAVDKLMSRIGF